MPGTIPPSETSDILYGTPQQVACLTKARSLWALLRDDPRFCYQARAVALADETLCTPAQVVALARLQGYASCHFVRHESAPQFSDAYSAAGLRPTVWNQFHGRGSALAASRRFVEEFTPPAGLQLRFVASDAPDSTIHAISRLSIESGVLPPPGAAMRGATLPGVVAFVETDTGEVVAAGGGFMAYHRDGPRADESAWGMLATHGDWRGQRLACWLGAEVILAMAERFGARGFSSGVKSDNPSSQAMCRRLGVMPSAYVMAGATDPAAFGNTSVTR